MKKSLILLLTYSAGVAGIFLAGYFFDFINLWQSFLAAFMIAVLFVLHLYRTLVKHKVSGKKKLTLVSALVILLSLQAVASGILYNKSVKQQLLLREIRTHISETLVKMEMERALHQTLRIYYSAENKKETESLEYFFRDLMNDRIMPGNALSASLPDNNQDFSVYYDFTSPDSLILTAVAKIAFGTDPEFDNLDDQTGMLQAKSILTLQGWTYAREN